MIAEPILQCIMQHNNFSFIHPICNMVTPRWLRHDSEAAFWYSNPSIDLYLDTLFYQSPLLVTRLERLMEQKEKILSLKQDRGVQMIIQIGARWVVKRNQYARLDGHMRVRCMNY